MSLAGWVKVTAVPSESKRKQMSRLLNSQDDGEEEGAGQAAQASPAAADPSPAKRPPPPSGSSEDTVELSGETGDSGAKRARVRDDSPSKPPAPPSQGPVNAHHQNYLNAKDWEASAEPKKNPDSVPAWARRGKGAGKRKRNTVVEAAKIMAAKKAAKAAKLAARATKDSGVVESAKPKKPQSSYMLFAKDKRAKVMEQHPGISMTDCTKELAKLWAEASQEEKETYSRMAGVEKEAYTAAMAQYWKDNPDATMSKAEAKRARKATQPKRPPTAYMMWLNESGRDCIKEEQPDLSAKDVLVVAGEIWRNMDDSDKQEWRTKAADASAELAAEVEAETEAQDPADGTATEPEDPGTATEPEGAATATESEESRPKVEIPLEAAPESPEVSREPSGDPSRDEQQQTPGSRPSSDEISGKSVSNPASLVGSPETEKEADAIVVRKDIAKSFFAPKKAAKKATATATTATKEAVVKETPTSAKNQSSSPALPVAAGAVKPADYNPSKAKYHPVNDACWGPGSPVPYGALASTFLLIEATTKRLEITHILSNFLRSVLVLSPADLVKCVYLCSNSLAPAFEGLELGIGESILMKAVVQATGASKDFLKARLVETGDLGEVAAASRGKQRTLSFIKKQACLTLSKVFDEFTRIARMTGGKSQQKKVDIINSLVVASQAHESKFIIRALEGKLRIGLAEQTVLQALGTAVTYTPPQVVEGEERVLNASQGVHPDRFKERVEKSALAIKTVFAELPSYDRILPIMLAEGVEGMSAACGITPGIPMKPMLAHPTKGIQEVFKRFEDKAFCCEYKYDGERAQVHLLANGEVHIYSRNSENNTSKYPDIIARMPTVIKDHVESFVIDCEAVAFDIEEKKILPFQVLSTRKRKDTDIEEIKVQVCLYAFDLIYLNGQSYVRRPFKDRREALHGAFTATPGEFQFATAMVSRELEDITVFLDQSIKDSCEGLMVKTLEEDATYEIARRSHSWLKVKKDYLDGVGDTLDLIVLGGWRGKGKRTGTYGAFLLGCYDPENEEVQSICKIGTGFSDEDLKSFAAFFKDHTIPSARSYYRYDPGLEPDDWFDAVQVWEVKAADLSISPRHKAAAGLVDPEKGISLRFPRFMRIRDDKKAEMATSAQQVATMYLNQDVIKE